MFVDRKVLNRGASIWRVVTCSGIDMKRGAERFSTFYFISVLQCLICPCIGMQSYSVIQDNIAEEVPEICLFSDLS